MRSQDDICMVNNLTKCDCAVVKVNSTRNKNYEGNSCHTRFLQIAAILVIIRQNDRKTLSLWCIILCCSIKHTGYTDLPCCLGKFFKFVTVTNAAWQQCLPAPSGCAADAVNTLGPQRRRQCSHCSTRPEAPPPVTSSSNFQNHNRWDQEHWSICYAEIELI
jgi:hypothetical protein